MLITAAFLLKGLRNAWRIALFLSIISFIGHLLKAIDYEEALLALGVAGMLVYSRKEYYIRSNPRFQFVGVRTALITMLVVIIYGTVGFYFLDEKHFNINFDLLHSVYYTMQNFIVIGSHLTPNSEFAHNFLLSINVCGFLSIAFLLYTMIRPFVQKNSESMALQQTAVTYLSQWGNSALDYFKTYKDKLLYIPEGIDGFISYKVSGSFAVVLENAVAKDDIQRKHCIEKFDLYCYENGLKAIYYRVAEADLPLFKSLKKRALFVGQEGIVDLNTFNLEGTRRRSLRNSIYRVVDKGYKTVIYEAPIKDGILQKLKAVSDEWLLENDRSEIVFSQGMFSWEELKEQTILTVENSEEKIVAFLNIIPDYAVNEATYDLMRKTSDAPSGVMDFMLIELFKYLKEKGFEFVNIGFAPLSGIESPQNLTERSMKFAYHQIQAFSHYRGMRDYKEKFASSWSNKYLVYENDFDLLQIPVVLGKVIKP
jgi:phosphatidylglycerol lysyltransferase